MKALAALVLIVGCGGSTPPAAKSPPPEGEADAKAVVPPADNKPADPVAPAMPPPDKQPAPPEPEFVHGGELEGPIPGMAGYSIKHKPDKTYCMGTALVMTRPKTAPKGDEKIAAVLAFEFPKDLDFSDKKKEASKKKFETWLADYTKAAQEASKFYTDQVEKGDMTAKVAALARLAQISQRFSAVLVHASIPPDIRSGEMVEDKVSAYCDVMAEQAVPLDARATTALKLCAEKMASVPKGWWTDVCTPK